MNDERGTTSEERTALNRGNDALTHDSVRGVGTIGPDGSSCVVRRAAFVASRRSGFTLLEVLLTLLIASLLIAAVGSALNLHLRLVEQGRSEVEQAQLARALLQRIAADLRNAVPVTVETSGTSADDAGASSDTSSSGAGSSGSGTGSGSNSAGGGGSGGSASSSGSATSGSSTSGGIGTATGITALKTLSVQSATSAGGSTGANSAGTTTDEASDDATLSPPGIYGTQTTLTVDVARSRPAAAGDSSPSSAPAGDMRSVAYYLSATSTLAYSGEGATLGVAAGGLVRREIDRAAAAQAATTGALDATPYERLLATEVTALGFRYFDGTEWLTEWDSSTRSALPVCVEVTLALRAASATTVANSPALIGAVGETAKTYRLLVHVPIAEPSTSADAATEASSSVETETP